MRYLLRKDTRHARWVALRARMHGLRFGDDFHEFYLATVAALYGIPLLLPGSTTSHATVWRVLARLLHGDIGVGAMFCLMSIAVWLAALRLVGEHAQQVIYLCSLSCWVGVSVAFAFALLISPGPYVALLNAFAAWIAYLNAEAP